MPPIGDMGFLSGRGGALRHTDETMQEGTRKNAETALSTPAGNARRAVSYVEFASSGWAALLVLTDSSEQLAERLVLREVGEAQKTCAERLSLRFSQ